MSQIKVLLALLVVAALLLVPAIASAQGEPAPCMFFGTVTVDGKPAEDGTEITAIIGNETVATTFTADGKYFLTIPQPEGKDFSGKNVTFTIGADSAKETGTWQEGEVTPKDLTVGEPVIPPGPGGCDLRVELGNVTKYDPATCTITIDKKAITGPQGPAGATGPKGDKGEPGKDASNVMGIVAIIIAVIALIVAVVVMMRKQAAKT
jgi:hypothetical protein